MADFLDTVTPTAISGCRQGAAVTPSDTVDLAFKAKALRASGGGNIAFIPAGNPPGTDTPITVTVAANETFDMFQVRRVMATNTTATGIVAGWN